MMIKSFQACFLFTLLLGCKVSTHTAYTYTEIQNEIEYGVFHGKILGTMRTVNSKRSVQGNPYSVRIWLSLNSKIQDNGCSLSIKALTLINDNTKEIVHTRDLSISEFEIRSNGKMESSFPIENVKLSHVDHTLTFNYLFSENCDVKNESGMIKMPFKKIYKVVEYNAWQLFTMQ